MALTCVRGLVDLVLKHNSGFCVRSVIQLRHFVNTATLGKTSRPPKRPTTAYFQFLQDKWPEVHSKNQGSTAVHISGILSKMWKSLPPNEREVFYQRYYTQREEYVSLMKQFEEQLTDQERAELKEQKNLKRLESVEKREKKKDKELLKDKPVGNRTAFALYVKSHRLGNNNIDFKTIAESWNNLPEEEKSIYRHDANLDQQRYEEEMAVFEDKLRNIGRSDLLRKKSRGTTSKKKLPKS